MISILNKRQDLLFQELLKDENITPFQEKSTLGKLFTSKVYPDIYVHSGTLDDKTIDIIQHCKKVIANSLSMKNILMKETKVDESKIDVLYPTINSPYLKPNESQRAFKEEFGIDEKYTIVLFTAKNFKKNGVKEFLNIIDSLNYKNFKAIIEGDDKQIYALKFMLTKYKLDDKVILLENYKNMDFLFSAADIFILPTFIQGFSTNVLRAMYFKTAVFITASNAAKELVDIFSTMHSPSDRSMQFKIDALFANKEELKKIKKENRKRAKELMLEPQLEKIRFIVSKT